MNILIIANGGEGIGLGHIIRTLALAKKLRYKHNVKYICNNNESFKSGREMLMKENFKIFTINNEEDVLKFEADFIIIDKYDVSSDYLKILSKKFIVMYIDDNNLLEYYPVNIVLNHNIYGKEINYKTKGKVLAGSKYTLIRSDFLNYRPIEIKENIKNILITVGGSDDFNLTEIILDRLPDDETIKHVVIAQSFKFKEKLLNMEKKNVKFHYNPNMATLIKEMDMAISACGSTLNELAYLGIPTVGIIVADNQIKLANYMKRNNCIILSDIKNLDKDISRFKYELRKELSNNMKKIIDGKGVLRIEKEIDKYEYIS